MAHSKVKTNDIDCILIGHADYASVWNIDHENGLFITGSKCNICGDYFDVTAQPIPVAGEKINVQNVPTPQSQNEIRKLFETETGSFHHSINFRST